MSERTHLTRDEHGYTSLSIPLSELLDSMNDYDRRVFVGYALLDGEFLRVLCAHIAAPDTELAEPPMHGGWLSCDDVRAARLALAPLLGDAIRDELEKAVDAAKSAEAAVRILRSLVHVRDMLKTAQLRPANDHHAPEEASGRREQLDDAWREAERWYNAENTRIYGPNRADCNVRVTP